MSPDEREAAIQDWITQYGLSREAAEWYVDNYGDEPAPF